MNADDWARVESIAATAAECAGAARQAFLDDACAGDDILRKEVESLLSYAAAADEFLGQARLEEAARLVARNDVAGRGPEIEGYDITEFLALGNGRLYRARDRRLERDVAIKVLHASDRDVPVRFEEEARAASALSHPNIVTIYAVGSRADLAYIVMELVQGRTLRALLADGPLPISATLDIAVQLADGLAAAHALGVVHRDLKPDNVMVTADWLVQIWISASPSSPFSGQRRTAGLSPLSGLTLLNRGSMSPGQGPARDRHPVRSFSFAPSVRALAGPTRSGQVDADCRSEPLPSQRLLTSAESASDDTQHCYLALEICIIRDDSVQRWRTGITRRRAIWLEGRRLPAQPDGRLAVRLGLGYDASP